MPIESDVWLSIINDLSHSGRAGRRSYEGISSSSQVRKLVLGSLTQWVCLLCRDRQTFNLKNSKKSTELRVNNLGCLAYVERF